MHAIRADRIWYRLCLAGALMLGAAVALHAVPAAAQEKAVKNTAEENLVDLKGVLDDLRKGGMVIYFRHATTEQGGNDENADLTKCETQRNLSPEGRQQAKRIGEAFQALGIPVGTVASSPFCRCQDTATLAFGKVTVNENLFFALTTDAARVATLSQALRGMLSAAPADGTNAVIVSHTANLREAAGIWPKTEGMAYIFRPLGDGRFTPVAKVLAEDWAAAAKLAVVSDAR